MTAKHVLHVLHGKDYDQMSSDELRETLAKLRKQKMVNEAKNQPMVIKKHEHGTGEIKQTKKSIARVLTILVKRGERCVS
jgi:ribosomal protein L29